MLTTREKGLIRALMYPVQFDESPWESADRVVRFVVQEGSLQANAAEYSSAIQNALRSQERLTDLLPTDQEEASVRRYLQQVRAHITQTLAVVGRTNHV